MIKKLFICMTVTIFMASACRQDQIPEPFTECNEELTYKTDVELIINESCAYSGCHISGTVGVPDYSTYNGLVEVIEQGSFEERVLIQMNMPPQNASGGPRSLTQEQKNTLRCWLEQGYPE